MSKRKRLRFDIDKVEITELSCSSTSFAQFLTSIASASVEELHRISSSTDDFLGLLSIKVGFVNVEEMLQIMRVVPSECGPWRERLAFQLLQLIHPTPTPLADALKTLLQYHSTSLPQQQRQQQALYSDTLDRILQSDASQPPFAGCLAPPTSHCLECGNSLQSNNEPCYITMYTMSGPIPLKKVELRCRQCNLFYGITKYGSRDSGYSFYSAVGVAEASDTCYIDRLVMNHFSSLK